MMKFVSILLVLLPAAVLSAIYTNGLGPQWANLYQRLYEAPVTAPPKNLPDWEYSVIPTTRPNKNTLQYGWQSSNNKAQTPPHYGWQIPNNKAPQQQYTNYYPNNGYQQGVHEEKIVPTQETKLYGKSLKG